MYLSKFFLFLKNKRKKLPVDPYKLSVELKSSESLSREQVEKVQLDNINNLLSSAKNHVDYYSSDLTYPDKPLNSINSFKEEIPEISKEDIIQNAKKMINPQIDSSLKHSTSGSTGKPLVIFVSRLAKAYRRASLMRYLSWWGVDERKDRSVLVWGFKKSQKKKGVRFKGLSNFLQNRLVVNIFDLNEKTIHKYYREIESFKPQYIRGYKSGLYMLASLMDQHGLKFKSFQLKVAIVTSEILFESERKFIEKVLNCRVANEFGAAECGLIGFECQEGSMHLNEDSVFVYTDSKNNVLVTELYNDKMPILKYKNNDKIEISEDYCSCGRSSRLIKNVDGRVNDFVVSPNGTIRHQSLFYFIMIEVNDIGYEGSVKHYKIVQRGNKFIYEIVPGSNYGDEVEEYITRRTKEEISSEISVEIIIVPEIKRDKSGKLRFFFRES